MLGLLLAVPGFASDTTGTWLPLEAEELDSPDRLEAEDPIQGLGARADRRDGRLELRHVWMDGRAGPAGGIRAEWIARAGSADWLSLRIQPGRRGVVAAGAVVVRHPPALLGEAIGLLRPLRSPRSAALRAPALEGPRGPSSAAVLGGAACASIGPAATWALAGRDAGGGAVRAAGVAARFAAVEAAVAAGSGTEGRRAASMAAAWAPAGTRLAFEALVSRERGPEILAEVIRRSGSFRVEARWRRRPGETRPVSGEMVVAGGTRGARTRLRWTPWSARAGGDDGRIELDTSFRAAGLGPARCRFGARSGEAASSTGAGARGERFVLADVVIARERGRSFALLASARERRRAGGVAVASALGGRLEVSGGGREGGGRGRAGATLVVQARRSGAGGADAAYTAGIASSGVETLEGRRGSGLAVSGRAWLRLGRIRLEGHFADASAPDRERPVSGSVRMSLDGRDQEATKDRTEPEPP